MLAGLRALPRSCGSHAFSGKIVRSVSPEAEEGAGFGPARHAAWPILRENLLRFSRLADLDLHGPRQLQAHGSRCLQMMQMVSDRRIFQAEKAAVVVIMATKAGDCTV